jgi:SAM-dependent methyltransferase
MTSPRPTDSQLEKYYLSQAYTSHIKNGKSLIDNAYLLARSFTLKWKLSLIERYNSSSNRELLDFGCGVGEFLKLSAENGWKIRGVEPSDVARKNADRKVQPYIADSLKGLVHQTARFAAISAWHVLEHVADLNDNLGILRSLLHPNGTLFIAVPNHNSWDAKHYEKHWAAYDVPRHLWHFNLESMKRLLSAHSLRVDAVLPMRLDAYYVSLLSEQYLGRANVVRFANAIINGLRSNYMARNNGEYSSLIYIVKK